MAGRFFPLKAFCPKTGDTVEFRLTAETGEEVVKYGPKVRHHELLGGGLVDGQGSCVQDVLRSPSVIYGRIRQFQEGGSCYCGIPSASWTEEGSQCPPKPGMVYAVYINPRGEVYLWRWLRADKSNPNIPEDVSGMQVIQWQKH